MHDDPTEHVQEEIHHHATHGEEHDEKGHGGHGGHHGPGWITAAALTAALLAALAAITASLANSHLTNSTLKRISALDRWNQFQAKQIKSSEADTRLMQYNAFTADAAVKVPAPLAKQHDDDLKKKKEYNQPADDEKNPEDPKGVEGLSKLAGRLDDLSKEHLETHETFELSETLFHISIAVVAIAVVAKRKEFWYMSMVGGVVGLFFFARAMSHAPVEKPEKPEAAAASSEKPGEKRPGEENKAPDEHKEKPAEGTGPAEHAG